MKRRVFSLFCLLCVCTAFLTGCWDQRELNKIALVMALGLDKTKGKEEYHVSYEVVNPTEISGKTGTGRTTPITVYSSSGSTIFEALRNGADESPRQLMISHTNVIIVGEELAKEGIHGILDFFERDDEGRLTSNLLIARNTKAEEVLKTLTPIEKVPALAIKGKLDTMVQKLSKGYSVELDEVIRGVLKKGGGPVISGVQLIEGAKSGSKESAIKTATPATVIKISGLGMLKGGKLVGWLNDGAARGAAVINNKLRGSSVSIDCKQNKNGLSIEVRRSKATIKTNIGNHIPTIQLFVKQEGSIGQIFCAIDLKKSKEIRKLEKKWAKETRKEVQKAIVQAQRKHTDIFGFGEALERANKQKWKEVEKDWGDIFAESKVEVHVETRIRRPGMRSIPYLFETE
ncbi:spore germination protein KC [Neobacillus bataviensis]|uniref:Spore germination protein KC n=1 Tax=Neobacillus bataviensis TaxID=220685 RepID=A0A561DNI9_9BACI|nr:Ger(x)C family spore germination protein [Neobacillus bataviensis]TWE04922.1 spore germination protein KC [Neobacillus bataviensis]